MVPAEVAADQDQVGDIDLTEPARARLADVKCVPVWRRSHW